MYFVKLSQGLYNVEIICASPERLINDLSALGINLYDLRNLSEICISCTIARKEFSMLQKLVHNIGGEVRILHNKGLYFSILRLLKRPIMLLIIILFSILSVYMPTRVLFVLVSGNDTVSTSVILDKAETCGVYFGASRRSLRSEQIKNCLLSEIPQLQWVGVNTVGCVAFISVEERSTISEEKALYPVGSIVACRDGIIREMTVIRGNPLCSPGQAVQEGQVLVSGYTDCGLVIKAELADAEICAQTRREITSISPAAYQVRNSIRKKEERYRIIIGKKSIKMYNDSGISDNTCVRIYTEKYITLPGGFQLPIAVITEQLFYYDNDTTTVIKAEEAQWLYDAAEEYLCDQMVAGRVLEVDHVQRLGNDVINLTGSYGCLEMIGEIRYEERYQINGKRSGKDY